MTQASVPQVGWAFPEANQDGFVAVTRMRKQVATLSADDFAAAFPMPALRSVDPADSSTGIRRLLPVPDQGVQLLTQMVDGVEGLRYLGKLAFVTKRPGNPYPHLISIGRSKTNDITVGVSSVSKVHGYFVHDEDGWKFTDHGSTNGSRLNRRKLDAKEKVLLEDGAVLQLGSDTAFQFHLPSSLYQRLQREP